MSKGWKKFTVGFIALIIFAVIASVFVDELFRGYLERKINQSLKGYTVRIERVRFHPIGFAVELENLVLARNERMDLPVVSIPRWRASLQWKALLFGRLVNDQYIERPTFRITRMLARQEAEDDVSVADRGWQDAVESIYPLKINEIMIADADLTYLDESNPGRPLRFQHVNVYASNIRNVHSRDQHYPSTLFLDGILFDSGRMRVDGHADFLAEPYVGVKANLLMEEVPLGSLIPVTALFNVQLSRGVMSAEGSVEYAPTVKIVDLKHLTIDGLHIDYVHAKQTKKAETTRAKATVSTAKSINADQETFVRIEEIKIVNGELGFVNQATNPEYRVFLTNTALSLENYTNQLRDGPASILLKGKFMGSGETDVTGILHPEDESPDFELKVKVANTRIRSMNNLLRAYGNFDVVKGLFSCYSELNFDDGKIRGYIKPLFRDLDVYDKEQDRDKDVLDKVREGAIEDMSSLLENAPREEIATKADVSGKADAPRTDTVQVVLRLIQNAFFKAILPGFEREFHTLRAKSG
ncbi:MAG TPA: DUF748 domain-containing protein [Nitrospira sp.]|nr:DUF748 domain-containing protein [Nitrospira sp.]